MPWGSNVVQCSLMSTVRLHRYCSFTMVVGGMLLQDFLKKWTKMCKYYKTLSNSKVVNYINILLYPALYHTCCRPVTFQSVLSLSPFLSHSRPVRSPWPSPCPCPTCQITYSPRWYHVWSSNYWQLKFQSLQCHTKTQIRPVQNIHKQICKTLMSCHMRI